MRNTLARWPYVSTSTDNIRHVSPRIAGLSQETIAAYDLAEDAFGVLLSASHVTIPTSRLTPEEREALVLAHQTRVAREMANQPKPKRGRTTTNEGTARSRAAKHPSLPKKMRYHDLKIVNCARCGRTLLGESQEPLRKAAIEAKKRTAANFPPPVAARLCGGRPYCEGCAAVVDPPG